MEKRLKTIIDRQKTKILDRVQIGGQTWYRLKCDKDGPVILWGFKGGCFLIGVGQGSLEAMLARMDKQPPAWLAAVAEQAPVPRRTGMIYLNIKRLREILVPLAGATPEVAAALRMLGLDNANAMVAVTGLEENGLVGKTLLALDGQPQGLLRLVSDRPLQPEDLTPIPRDATLALAARLDLQQAVEIVRSSLEMGHHADWLDLGALDRQLHVDLRRDLLASLGDTWRIYNSPAEGGLVITGLTAVVPLRDRPAFARVYSALVQRFAAAQDPWNPSAPRIRQFRFAGRDVYWVNYGPLTPAWCQTDTEFIAALSPQNIKAYLSRRADSESLAAAPEVARLLSAPDRPVMLGYCDTAKLFELIYPLVVLSAQSMSAGSVDFDASALPSASAIGRHLRPGLATLRRSKYGIETTSHYSLPCTGDVVSLGFMVEYVPLMLLGPTPVSWLLPSSPLRPAPAPSPEPAKDDADLRQIGKAMQAYVKAEGTLPPAYTCDKSGKPLLSWRVAILPYLGEEALYKQFHLDEPWDGTRNKELASHRPSCFARCKSQPGDKTNYLTVRGQETVFPGKRGVRMEEIKGGLAATIMVVEVIDAWAVVWTKPDNFEYDEKNPASGLGPAGTSPFIALHCDGLLHYYYVPLPPVVLRAMYGRGGGKPLDPKELATWFAPPLSVVLPAKAQAPSYPVPSR